MKKKNPSKPRRYAPETIETVRTAYLAGGNIRTLARDAGIPEATALAWAKKRGWSAERDQARAIVASRRETPDVARAAALSLAERGQRHIERMAGVSERVAEHLEAAEPAVLLEKAGKVDRYDRFARRQFGLKEDATANMVVNFGVRLDGPRIECHDLADEGGTLEGS